MLSEILFKPSSDLSFNTVQSDGKRLLTLLHDNQTTTIRLDLCDVTYCDSAGLALLIEARRLCMQFDKKLMIERMPKTISALAEFCGVDTILVQT